MDGVEILITRIEKLHKSKQISLDTSIIDFIDLLGRKRSKVKPGSLPDPLYFSLREIGRYVETIGDLKKLAENADGFARLKRGVYFNERKCLPIKAYKTFPFGKKKLDCLNHALAEYGINPIPWMTRKYSPWERQKERGWNWYKELRI